jgi:hypothetical protein
MSNGTKRGMAQPEIRLSVVLNPANGSTRVEGPIHDKILCYGLLEVARQSIQQYDPMNAGGPPKIEYPTADQVDELAPVMNGEAN